MDNEDHLQAAINNTVELADEAFKTTLALLKSARDVDVVDADSATRAAMEAFHIFNESAERVTKMAMAQQGIRAVIVARGDTEEGEAEKPAEKPKEYIN